MLPDNQRGCAITSFPDNPTKIPLILEIKGAERICKVLYLLFFTPFNLNGRLANKPEVAQKNTALP